ncbi:hypothetical protein HpCHN43_14730 [Helicobacter pylori]
MGQIPLDPPINQNKEISEYSNKQVIKSLRLSKEQWQTIQTQMQEKNLNFSQLVLNSLLIQNS